MEFTSEYQDKINDITAMFRKTFTDSEGAQEGQTIQGLVSDMLASLGSDDMHVFSAVEDGELLGSVIFTRMKYEQDARVVFILSPVAVSTKRQGEGIGQRLIGYGIRIMRANGVHVVLTYGDINFYSKVGFRLITEADAQAPLPLQYPEGWLGQWLDGSWSKPLVGPAQCVDPLNDPSLW